MILRKVEISSYATNDEITASSTYPIFLRISLPFVWVASPSPFPLPVPSEWPLPFPPLLFTVIVTIATNPLWFANVKDLKGLSTNMVHGSRGSVQTGKARTGEKFALLGRGRVKGTRGVARGE